MAYSDPFDDPEFQAFAASVRSELLPMFRASAVTMLIAAPEPDVKLAVELGLSILLGKPIVIAVPPGVGVPEKLMAIADRVVEWNGSSDEVAGQRIATAIAELTGAQICMCPVCGHATKTPVEGRQHGYCEHCHDYTGVPTEIPKAS